MARREVLEQKAESKGQYTGIGTGEGDQRETENVNEKEKGPNRAGKETGSGRETKRIKRNRAPPKWKRKTEQKRTKGDQEGKRNAEKKRETGNRKRKGKRKTELLRETGNGKEREVNNGNGHGPWKNRSIAWNSLAQCATQCSKKEKRTATLKTTLNWKAKPRLYAPKKDKIRPEGFHFSLFYFLSKGKKRETEPKRERETENKTN